MDKVTTAEALHLLSGAFRSRLCVAAGLMGSDEVASAFGTDPLAYGGIVREVVEVRFGMFGVVEIGQRDRNGETARRRVGVVWGECLHNAHVEKLVC